MTYTFVDLVVSFDTWHEIKNKLEKAGYQHAFHTDSGSHVIRIDMHGIALTQEEGSSHETR